MIGIMPRSICILPSMIRRFSFLGTHLQYSFQVAETSPAATADLNFVLQISINKTVSVVFQK